jgi:hypothetical protein
MKPTHTRRDPQAVFLNVPFDAKYESLFIALIATLIALGRKPRCVLEIPDLGKRRLSRIVELLDLCRVSIHDLSRVGASARFNMPFELGLAVAAAILKPEHDYIVLERERFRLDKTLSDLKGCDPVIHRNRVGALIGGILDVVGATSDNPDPKAVQRLYRQLRIVGHALKNQYGRPTVFSRSIFLSLVAAGTQLAAQSGIIRGGARGATRR